MRDISICTSNQSAGQATVSFSVAGLAEKSSPGIGGSVSGLRGQLRGPFCKHSRTLPSNCPVVDGVARVVDPCYWTPKLPFLYEATVCLNDGTECCFRFGLRWCKVIRSGLRLDGKPFVYRAVQPAEPLTVDGLNEARELSTGIIVSDYDEKLFEAASEIGVMLCVLDEASQAGEREYGTGLSPQMSQFPAVHFFQTSTPAGSSDLSPVIQKSESDTRLDRAILLTEEHELDSNIDYAQRPCRFLIRRKFEGSTADLRRECDRLQRDAARFGQFAGYLISST